MQENKSSITSTAGDFFWLYTPTNGSAAVAPPNSFLFSEWKPKWKKHAARKHVGICCLIWNPLPFFLHSSISPVILYTCIYSSFSAIFQQQHHYFIFSLHLSNIIFSVLSGKAIPGGSVVTFQTFTLCNHMSI